MARYHSSVDMSAARDVENVSEVVDVAVFGVIVLLSAIFVIMAGYVFMAWL